MINSIFLSPHLDDAVLSCGGGIYAKLRSDPDVLIVTIFAGSPLKRQNDRIAKPSGNVYPHGLDPISIRKIEDRNALTLLGAKWRHLEFCESYFRLFNNSEMYSSETMWEDIHPLDYYLINEWIHRFENTSLSDIEIYCPLAVGNHVDHQLVRNFGLQMHHRGYLVFFYEDFPYCENQENLQKALLQVNNSLCPTIVEIDVETKMKAIACYRSQLRPLFQGETQMRERVKSYTLWVGSNTIYAERYWRIT